MSNRLEQVSVTPTVARQTPRNEFGNVLKQTLENGVAMAGSVLMAGTGGIPIVSAAVSAVSAITSMGRNSASQAASGIQGVGTSVPGVDVGTSGAGAGGGSVNDMMAQMRREADRSLLLQMQMQEESREYNTVSNVLKTRHDSAKAAINNIR